MCKSNVDDTFSPMLTMLREYYRTYADKPCTYARIPGAATREHENKYHDQLAKDMQRTGK